MSLIEKANNSTWSFIKPPRSSSTNPAEDNIKIHDAVIIFKNFEGRPTKFNSKGGSRSFNLVLPNDLKDILVDYGWNIRRHPARTEDGEDMFSTEIMVNYRCTYPPQVELLTCYDGKKRRRKLSEESIGVLDKVEIETCDVIIHPHARIDQASGELKYKGYLNNMQAKQYEEIRPFGDRFSDYRYDDEPEDDED